MHRLCYKANTELPNHALSYVANEKTTTILDVQLRSALRWWLRVLPMNATRQEIPDQLRTSVKSPVAAFLKVPREVRMLWSSPYEHFGANFWDSFEIEAIGFLVILATCRIICRIHFMDNTAQASLVCGSSSVTSGDDIVGFTREMMAQQRIIPYVDRVESASNPADGLSRG